MVVTVVTTRGARSVAVDFVRLEGGHPVVLRCWAVAVSWQQRSPLEWPVEWLWALLLGGLGGWVVELGVEEQFFFSKIVSAVALE